jgi:hypothetical protein
VADTLAGWAVKAKFLSLHTPGLDQQMSVAKRAKECDEESIRLRFEQPSKRSLYLGTEEKDEI